MIRREELREARERYYRHQYELVYCGDDMLHMLDVIEELTPNIAGITGSFDGVTDTRKITIDFKEYNKLLGDIERLQTAIKDISDGNNLVDWQKRVVSQALEGERS